MENPERTVKPTRRLQYNILRNSRKLPSQGLKAQKEDVMVLEAGSGVTQWKLDSEWISLCDELETQKRHKTP